MEIHNNFFNPLERAATAGDTFPSPTPSQPHHGQPDAITTHPSVSPSITYAVDFKNVLAEVGLDDIDLVVFAKSTKTTTHYHTMRVGVAGNALTHYTHVRE